MSIGQFPGVAVDPQQAVDVLYVDAPAAVQAINAFTESTFRTRGGRLGSGMGSLLEALWVYHMNSILQNQGGVARLCELGWLQDHEPADFACLIRGAHWDPASRLGELFRIEAKSMNIGVDEAKGHFTNLAAETSPFDQLLVLIWSWQAGDNGYFWPRVHDYFLSNSLDIIQLRDALHAARGGTFVLAGACPDGCADFPCSHVGEPLNASGKRERRSGPHSCKPANVEYAANFGGLVRMLKTDGDAARQTFRALRRQSPIAHAYISFIHYHFQAEEVNQYRVAEWRTALKLAGIPASPSISPIEANTLLRQSGGPYQDLLRDNF